MWCAPHIEGQYLRDEITKLVTWGCMQDRDWFLDVYDLLEIESHEVDLHALYKKQAEFDKKDKESLKKGKK